MSDMGHPELTCWPRRKGI